LENIVTTDAVISRELKSLQDELSTSNRERRSPSADQVPASDRAAAKASQPEDTAEEPQLQRELHELVNTITEFVEEAEENISAHPTASVVGALVVGILIGRLLGRS
jgi:ElaB/YqjD/DUF883 family membrane-anchored ribosome-binding protein